MLNLDKLLIPQNENIIALATFGSYGTDYWIKNKSDIDIFVLTSPLKNISEEFDLEDDLLPVLEGYFNYPKIHLTFLYLNDFASPLAKQYIDSKNKLVLDPLREMDFRLYVNKYLRSNEWLDNLINDDTLLMRGEVNHDTIL